ncbi:MAG: 4Fe-4S dicluster domain-containing protein [Deltaproteobacteria bacterium]|jgi:ferredoxin|nr:4Fe-4S dicluster domain-containing protein [Deltaproteobacteria bacterium]
MKPVVFSDKKICVGCNKCSRSCPAPSANIVSLDPPETIQISIDYTRCLACGACLTVCNHGARTFRDDIDKFFYDLKKGTPISLIASASTRTNFPNYRQIIRWLKSLGVRHVYDGTLGFELFSWSIIYYIEHFRPFSLITSFCPVVTSYCRIFRPELIPRLAPVHGPISSLGIYLKNYHGITDVLGALTPCITGSKSAAETNVISYNITFLKLYEYIKKNNIILPVDGDELEHPFSEPNIRPISPSIKSHLIFYFDSRLRIDCVTGQKIFPLLDAFSTANVDHVPAVFDVRYCAGGCNLGIGKNPENNYFHTRSILNQHQRFFSQKNSREYCERLFRIFEDTIDFEDLVRTYPQSSRVADKDVSEAQLEEAFRSLGKTYSAFRHFDCSFCGCNTCLEMAYQVARKKNIPINCVTRMRQVTEETNQKITAYIELIHNVSEYLLTTVGNDFTGSVEHALMALCYAMDGLTASLWKNIYDEQESPKCYRIVTFPAMLISPHFNTLTIDDPPGWLDTLVEGNSIVRLKNNMTHTEQQKFLGRNINAMILNPVISQGDFWGFIALFRQEEVNFSEQDISVISVCSNLLASYMINLDLQGNVLDTELGPL